MTLRVANEFGYQLTNDLDPASAILGVTLTPGQNTFPTPVAVYDNIATHAWWPADSDDAYGIELEFSGISVSSFAKDALARIYYESTVSGVNVVDNELNYATPHGLDTADGPLTISTTVAAPGGLATATQYWVIFRSKTSVALATSEANARAGIAIDITSAGSGTHTTTSCKIRDLSVSCAGASSGTNLTGGRRYYFPLWIPRLTKIMASVSVNNATVGTAGCWIKLYAKPTKPWTLRALTFIRTFGSNPASSSGTAVTPGMSADGAYVEIGTLQEDLSYWVIGPCINQSAMANTPLSWDLALGSVDTKRLVIENDEWAMSSAEVLAEVGSGGSFATGVNGEKCFVRSAYTGTPIAGFSAIVYGGGGRFVPDGAFTVSGSVTLDGAPVSQVGGVDVFAVDSDGIADLVVQNAGIELGTFSVLVPDGDRLYQAVATVATLTNTFIGASVRAAPLPDPDQYRIDIVTSVSSSNEIVSVSASPLTRFTPIVVRMNISGALPWIVMSVNDEEERLIFNPTRPSAANQSGDQRWSPSFRERSTITQNGAESLASILPSGGWHRDSFKLIIIAGTELT